MARKEETIVAGVRLTSPGKVIYPDQGITKQELAEYYVAVADWMLPEVAGRPLSLVRCPAGEGKACFFQKHVGSGVPDEIRIIDVPDGVGTATHDSGTSTYLMVEDVKALVAMAQIGALEIHPWGSIFAKLETPDRLIFDLDPDTELGWERVVEGAFAVRDGLERLGLRSFLKTTGGKGLHVVVPVVPSLDWEEAKAFARAFAERTVAEAPELFTLNMLKKKRVGRIFLDYLRNSRAATSVAAYSTRARPGATASTPIAWSELTPALRSDDLNLRTVPRRLARLKRDPWAEIGKTRQRITAAMRRDLEGAAPAKSPRSKERRKTSPVAG
jgi:bifunctional non-homologous end joining protein LigD